MKKIAFYTAIIAIIFTSLSPKIFSTYIEKPLYEIESTVSFGGPIPFLKQEVRLSDNPKDYPLEMKIQSLKETKTSFSAVPFLFSFIITFFLLFSIVILFLRFITKGVERDHN